jgi:opacity protein-like surface antigen
VKGKRVLECFAVILLMAGSASADDDGFSRSGPYLGVGATGAIHLFEDDVETQSAGFVEVDQSPGLNARVGYRVLSWLALEAQYEWVSGFDFVAAQDIPANPLIGAKSKGTRLARLQSHAVTADLKLLLPIWRFQPYLIGGVGAAFYEFDDKTGAGLDKDETAFVGRVGLGADVYITKHLLAFVEGTGLLSTLDITDVTNQANISDLHYFSLQLGLQYRF